MLAMFDVVITQKLAGVAVFPGKTQHQRLIRSLYPGSQLICWVSQQWRLNGIPYDESDNGGNTMIKVLNK